ncbi:MAG: DUF4236 domain-containing protein [Ruminiclostridium sp.]|nr:DUF4236 domain-containing protein [Ruminiclostridium sp.]
MGLRFHKSINICKGVKLNLSKSGVGVSLGTNGARYSLNTSGRRTATFGIPGTGLSYVKTFSSSKKKKSTSEAKTKREELKKEKEQLAAQKAEQKADELRENTLKAEEAANYIDVIKSVHKECENDVDWSAVLESPPPFVKGQPGPREQDAQKALDNYKPGLAGKLFGDAKAREKLETELADAKKADEAEFADWQASYKFAQRVIDGDIDAYLEVIEESNPFEDLVEYGSGFEFGTDDPSVMETEFRVKADEVVPKTAVTVLKSGKLSEKELSKTAYYDLVQDYVCSCAVRIAREIFALLPVGGVIVHAVDNVLDTSTGNDEEVTILSVLFERERFDSTNFDRIDPSDFVNSFTCNMKFTKTTGFKPVRRLGE